MPYTHNLPDMMRDRTVPWKTMHFKGKRRLHTRLQRVRSRFVPPVRAHEAKHVLVHSRGPDLRHHPLAIDFVESTRDIPEIDRNLVPLAERQYPC